MSSGKLWKLWHADADADADTKPDKKGFDYMLRCTKDRNQKLLGHVHVS